MNLFASFILRALSVLIKDALLDATKKTSHWSTSVNNEVRMTTRLHIYDYVYFGFFFGGMCMCYW